MKKGMVYVPQVYDYEVVYHIYDGKSQHYVYGKG